MLFLATVLPKRHKTLSFYFVIKEKNNMGIISTAYAADAAAQQGGGLQMIFLLVIFGLIFYFMIFRPQSKRNKQHREFDVFTCER